MFVSDASHPHDLVRQLPGRARPGSYLSLSHLTDGQKPPARAEGFRAVFDTATEHLYFRSKSEVAAFFDGLDLVAALSRAPSPASPTPASGAPKTPSWPTATVHAGCTAGWPGSRDGQAHSGDLGLDPGAQRWQRSGDGAGAIEVAFARASSPEDWVLMRVAADPDGRVLVFDRNEWECFLDGARKGEFDDAASLAP